MTGNYTMIRHRW